jgi:hypothetical protein
VAEGLDERDVAARQPAAERLDPRGALMLGSVLGRRPMNTGREMVASGQWAKIGKKHYRHVSGIEVWYDCNAWKWRTSLDKSLGWSALWVARYEVERSHEATIAWCESAIAAQA